MFAGKNDKKKNWYPLYLRKLMASSRPKSNTAIVKFRGTFKGSKLAGVAQCRICCNCIYFVYMISIF